MGDLTSAAEFSNIVSAVPVLYQMLIALKKKIRKQDKPDQDILAQVDEIESRLSEINGAVIFLQAAEIKSNEKIKTLQSELDQAKQLLEARGSLLPAYNAYWEEKGDGVFDGPFSTSEVDKNGKLVRMRMVGHYNPQDGEEHVTFEYVFTNYREHADVPVEFLQENKWPQFCSLYPHSKREKVSLTKLQKERQGREGKRG